MTNPTTPEEPPVGRAQPMTVLDQFRNNAVAILSLAVALAGFGYTTWRNERTEANRTVRVAAFEILKTLGELQLIVDYAHFRHDHGMGDPTLGWGKVLFIKDMAQLVPAPVPDDTERLLAAWRDRWERIETDNDSAQAISEEIYRSRTDVAAVLHRLR